jgi:hypothetical protein
MDLPAGLTLSIEDKPAEADVEALPDGLEAFNERQWPGHQPWQPLRIFIRRGGTIAAGTGDAHRLVNRTTGDAVLPEVGDRTPLDRVTYPEDDLAGEADAAGRFHYRRKDGTPL